MLTVPLAYKYVAVAAMLAEINFCAARLHLPGHFPLSPNQIQKQMVFHPHLIGFAGRIDAEGYSFSFAKSGQLRYITAVDEQRNVSNVEYLRKLSKKRGVVDESAAYRLATNWLWSIDVDVSRVEREHPHVTRQREILSRPSDTNHSPYATLPLFDVRWCSGDEPIVEILISGCSGEFVAIRQEDVSYSRRPAELLKNTEGLLAISDEGFLTYSAQQRSNLVARFTAMKYSSESDRSGLRAEKPTYP
jgi:hypothetical protein